MVRITVNTPEAASQVAEIRRRLDDMGCAVPLVGDFHFNGERLLAEFPDCAKALSKYRINPGNVGKGAKGDEKFAYMIRTAAGKDVFLAGFGHGEQTLFNRVKRNGVHQCAGFDYRVP